MHEYIYFTAYEGSCANADDYAIEDSTLYSICQSKPTNKTIYIQHANGGFVNE